MVYHSDPITFDYDHGVPNNAAAVYEILHKYDNRFSYTEGDSYIRVEDSFNIVFTHSGGINVDGRPLNVSSGNYILFTVFTGTIVYCLIKTQTSSASPVGGFCWIKSRNINYLGAGGNGAIDAMSFSDKTTLPENRYYTIKKHAQFPLNNQSILFITTSIICDNDGNYQTLNDLRSCSTVTFNTTISVNYSNYYAIGTNTLVRDDIGA